MVAYSFQKQFHKPIRELEKTGTVRGDRPRHARIGEPVQLYAGMRTRNCFKLLTPDPICIDTPPILITFDRDHAEIITSIRIDGGYLNDQEIEDFAAKDGFGVNYPEGTARWRMGDFWQSKHGFGDFFGVWIKWEPR